MEGARGGPSSASSGGGGVYGSLKDWSLNWRRPQYPTPSAYTSSGSKSGSGTTLSNTYTSGSGASHLSSYDHRLLNALVVEERAEELAKERAEDLWGATNGQRPEKSFCGGAANGNFSALERWLMALDVGWVLCIADDASAAAAAGGLCHLSSAIVQRDYAGRWIQALAVITHTILRAYSDPFWCGLSDLYILLKKEEPVTEQEQEQDLDQLQLTRARFGEAAILRMLPFVDAIAASSLASASAGGDINLASANGAPAPTERLQALLNVRDALSNASSGIQLWLHSASSAEAKQKSDEVLGHLAAKEKRLDEAIWSTMEGTRAHILSPPDDKALWGAQSPQGSPDVVRVTRSLVNHIRLLWGNEKLVRHIVGAAAELGDYVPEYDRISCFLSGQEMSAGEPFASLTLEMVSSLEEKLAKRSESFPDHGLRVLFLINNTRFIWQQLHPLLLSMERHMSVLARRIEDYIQRYLQVSWAPVVSCLYDLTPPVCFGRNNSNSCLLRFESEFQKTYFAQKLWKVPDPELRRRLRQAVTERVVSGFREYLEHDNISTSSPRATLTPLELEHMLQELFEG